MKLIKLIHTDPKINLAVEEYLLKEYTNLSKDDLCILWKNDNTIVVGNNQDTFAEINHIYVNDNKINVVRRITGGGCVYHDTNNINFTFIKRNQRKEFNFKTCLVDILDFLNHLNLNAYFSGRNDILICEKKVSGTAVTFYKNDYLIHGTLLFDVNVDVLINCLNVDTKKISSKGITSIKSRVVNIKEYLPNTSINEFESQLINFLENKYHQKIEHWDLSNNNHVKKLINDKYDNYDFVYGKNYFFNFKNSIKNENGLISVNINIDLGKIKDIHFYTDYIFGFDFSELINKLKDQKYEIEAISNIISSIDFEKYFFNKEELIKLIFENK